MVWTALVASAQTDTLPYIPLYENAASKNAPAADNHSVVHVASNNDFIANEDLRTFYNLYAAGKYREAIAHSRRMSTADFDKLEHQFHLKYAIAAYKEMELNEEADSLAKLFYQKNPFYETTLFDPVSFRELLDNYYTMPKFSVWLALSNNIVMAKVDTVFVISNDTMQRKPDYKFNSFGVQVGFEYHPLKWLSVSVSPTLTHTSYTRSIRRHEMSSYKFSDEYTTIAFPMRIEAGLYRRRAAFVPSVFAGFQPKIIVKSDITSTHSLIGAMDDRIEKSNADDKNKVNYSVLGGVRLSYNIHRLTLFGEVCMSMDTKTFYDTKKQYLHPDIVYKHLYIPDVFLHQGDVAISGCKAKPQVQNRCQIPLRLQYQIIHPI